MIEMLSVKVVGFSVIFAFVFLWKGFLEWLARCMYLFFSFVDFNSIEESLKEMVRWFSPPPVVQKEWSPQMGDTCPSCGEGTLGLEYLSCHDYKEGDPSSVAVKKFKLPCTWCSAVFYGEF